MVSYNLADNHLAIWQNRFLRKCFSTQMIELVLSRTGFIGQHSVMYESFLDNKANTLVRNPNLDVIEFWLNKGVDIVDKRGFRGFVLNLPLELIIFPRGYATCAVRK